MQTDFWGRARFAAEDEGAGGGSQAGDAAAGAAADAKGGDAKGSDANGGGGRWWEGSDYTAEERQWIEARGLTEDDPAKIVPRLVKGHRAAEGKLGKGIDTIMDRPKQGQDLAVARQSG